MTYSPAGKTEQPATEKQTSFIVSLLEQRQTTPEVKAHVEGQVASDTMTKAEASKRIEWLLAQPKVEKPKPVYVDAPEGMHKVEGKIFKVYKTRNGYIVAAELVGMMTDEGEVWGFQYRGKSGLKGLSEATRMPAEDAKAFGKTYGICVRCALHLTDERSIFAGYGPVCAKHEGWYYPKMDEAMEGLGITPESVAEALIAESGKLTTEDSADLAELEAKADDEWYYPTMGEVPEQPDDFDEVAEEGKEAVFDPTNWTCSGCGETGINGMHYCPTAPAPDGWKRVPGSPTLIEPEIPMPTPEDFEKAAAVLATLADELSERGIIPKSASLAAADIAERMDRICDQPGCDNKVFTDDDIKDDIHLTINPDYCADHDWTEPIKTHTTGLAMELLPEDL